MPDDLNGWTPTTKVVFDDEELIQHLRRTLDQPEERTGNWWTFLCALPAPERARLEAEASARGKISS